MFDVIIWVVLGIIVLVIIVLAIASLSGGKQSDEEQIEKAGLEGEQIANKYFRELIKEDEFMFSNLLVPTQRGNKTEIDSVIISRKGIFCIEVKRWSGTIVGTDDSDEWIQIYDCTNERKSHYNPVKQNNAHCEILQKYLKTDIDVYNVVAFVDLKDASGIESKHIGSIETICESYKELDDDQLSIEEVKDFACKLFHCVATKEELEEHKKELQSKYNR